MRRLFGSCFLAALCLAILVAITHLVSRAGHANQKSKQAALNKDFSKELPRIPGKSPADSLKSFQVHPDFRLELVAAEPLIHDPIAIDIDEDGRMYVVQLPSYNGYAFEDKGKSASATIQLLIDTDGDGQYDKATVFVDNVRYPSGIACWDGGVFVGDAPDLIYFKDTNGDGKADVRKVIFTGFGTEKPGEAELNSFRWMFDNRIHISTGLYGGNVKAAASKSAKPQSVRNRGFIFDPRDLSKFELTSGGGQHGLGIDDWGQKYVCSNSVPAQTLMYDGRYLARNPYLKAPAAAVNIVKTGKFTELHRISAAEPWRVLRTKLRASGAVGGSAEGGKPFGFFTGATGITIYRGDAWPKEFRGNLIVGDVANNLIFRAHLKRDGLTIAAVRADKNAEFAASRDIWTRPVQFANAPDGTLYAIDMYRELIEGAAFLPPDVLKHLNVAGGNDTGRIYRIAPKNFKQPKPPRLSKATTAELVALLDHRNGWHRDTASRLIYQRQDRSAIEPLNQLLKKANLPEGRMYALYSLDGLQALTVEHVLQALNDPSPNVRIHALRISEQFAAESAAVRARYAEMTADSDLQVRYQLAYTLGESTGRFRTKAITELLLQDGNQSWMRIAALSSLADGSGDVFRLLIADKVFRSSSHGRAFLKTLASQIGAANKQNDIAAILKGIQSLSSKEQALKQQVVQSLVSNQKSDSRKKLANANQGEVGTILSEIINEAKKVAADEKRPVAARVDAIRTLGLSSFDDLNTLITKLLELHQPQPVQAAVLETVASFNHDGVPTLLIEAWPTLSPQLRAKAAETLFSRTSWTKSFLSAVKQEKIGRGDIDPARIKLLQTSGDEKIRRQAAQLFAANTLSRRKDVVAAYQKSLTLDGDVMRGKAHFKKVCSACHKLEGVGNVVGADLTAIRNRGIEAVLLNILDPNREVKPKFLSYTLVTAEGKIITGMITEENANSITIRRVDGTTANVLRIDIELLKSSGLSYMPEGLEKQLDQQAMADLLAYLNSIK